MAAPRIPWVDRAKFHIDENGCYIWEGFVGKDGYGRTTVLRRCEGAHRAAWLELVGPIPDGLHLDHLCRTPACINVDHLEPVTHKENQRRRALAQTQCKRGHEYTPDNTYINDGARVCRTCQRKAGREWVAARRAARGRTAA